MTNTTSTPKKKARQRILEAAAESFQTLGYARTTTHGIADKVAVAAVALFRHFGDKQTLFQAVFQQIGGGEIILRLLSPKRLDYKEKIWDQAAGSLVLTEAGGRISDLEGKPLDFTQGRMLLKNRGVLATNGVLHEAALNALKEVGA